MGERKFYRNLRYRESRRAVCLCCVRILCFCSEKYGKVWQHVGCQRCNVPAIQCRNLCVVTAKTQIHTRTHIHLPKRSVQNKQKEAVSFVAPTVFVSLPRGVSSLSPPPFCLSFVCACRSTSLPKHIVLKEYVFLQILEKRFQPRLRLETHILSTGGRMGITAEINDDWCLRQSRSRTRRSRIRRDKTE